MRFLPLLPFSFCIGWSNVSRYYVVNERVYWDYLGVIVSEHLSGTFTHGALVIFICKHSSWWTFQVVDRVLPDPPWNANYIDWLRADPGGQSAVVCLSRHGGWYRETCGRIGQSITVCLNIDLDFNPITSRRPPLPLGKRHQPEKVVQLLAETLFSAVSLAIRYPFKCIKCEFQMLRYSESLTTNWTVTGGAGRWGKFMVEIRVPRGLRTCKHFA